MSIKPLRRVRDHEHYFEASDHNDHVDNWRIQLDLDQEFAARLSDPPAELADLINRLANVVGSMRRVTAGDWYFAEDHNKFVDAWEIQSEINSIISSRLPAVPPVAPAITTQVTFVVYPPKAMSAGETISGLSASPTLRTGS